MTRPTQMAAEPELRVEPLCPHAPACGGCAVQHLSDRAYESWKIAKLHDVFRSHGLDIGTCTSELVRVPLGSRRRAVLTGKPEAEGYRLGFHEERSHTVVDIKACAVLRPSIVAALGPLRQVAQVLAPGGGRLAVLDVGAGLDVAIETSGRRRHDFNLAQLTRLAASGRILRLTLNSDPVLLRATPVLDLSGVGVVPPPGAFMQAAAEAETAMARLAVDAIVATKAKRVADLFCGIGTFTFALARRARVLAIDGDRPMIDALADAARHATGLKPIEARVRDLFRDPLSRRELDQLNAVVLDPPRAGAKPQVEAMAASRLKSVVAISCNPATLARDLRILIDGGFRLEHVTPIDQFLFTPHLEAVAVLSRD